MYVYIALRDNCSQKVESRDDELLEASGAAQTRRLSRRSGRLEEIEAGADVIREARKQLLWAAKLRGRASTVSKLSDCCSRVVRSGRESLGGRAHPSGP
jgi:hypothetical protein